MAERIRIPQQALVLWRGSQNDKFPDVYPTWPGYNRVEVTLSGHKQPIACLQRVEELQRDFPDGGVILAIAGGSNGLGPMDAANTTWPVISVPPGIKDFPDDIWSSLRMPRDVPNATILDLDNAFSFALNIFAKTNPIIYMVQRFAIEERMES
ncbi:MAG: AIR carboxylase family protein [Patescibacteria group bacterium]